MAPDTTVARLNTFDEHSIQSNYDGSFNILSAAALSAKVLADEDPTSSLSEESVRA